MKNIILVLLLSFIGSKTFAGNGITYQSLVLDDSTNKQESHHMVGLNAGFITGLGLTYRYAPSNFMHQVSFLPVVSPNTTLLGLAYTLFYRVKRTKHIDFIVYWGNNYINGKTNNNFLGFSEVTSQSFNTGLGYGFDFKLGENFTFNLMTGYALFTKSRETPSYYMTAELGLFYKL